MMTTCYGGHDLDMIRCGACGDLTGPEEPCSCEMARAEVDEALAAGDEAVDCGRCGARHDADGPEAEACYVAFVRAYHPLAE